METQLRLATASDLELFETQAIERGRSVIEYELKGLKLLKNTLGSNFSAAVKQILHCKGRVIVSGLGKSGHVAVKISATLSSTGSPSLFLHATEAAHGDMGIISANDLIILISNSGETPDLIPIIRHTTRLGVPMIGITSIEGSMLDRNATISLILPKAKEACKQGIAPTTSTTMTLALGDALAMAVMDFRGFSRDDLRLLHPGGNIGLRLMKISEMMHRGDRLPLVKASTPMPEVIMEMTSKSMGIAGVIDEDGNLIGVVTDGDLRRNADKLNSALASQVMSNEPTVIPLNTLAEDALRILHNSKITALFVIDENTEGRHQTPVGIVTVHDFLRLGLS